MPDWSKLIEAKTKLARRGAPPGKQGPNLRVPPGQKEVTDFPVLDLGLRPDLSTDNWQLRLFGRVQNQTSLSFAQFSALPQVTSVSDFHCVTHWTQLDMRWEGVAAVELVKLGRPQDDAGHVTLHGADDYTTNLPLEALLDDDVLLAHRVNGEILSPDHGGPVRLVVPKRYGWKSAKWITGIEFHIDDRPGFWEERGYHNEADPWKEQRFSGS
jgi:DMSO/TMAO reductase YedYZ molybdopterin-dependent catalytic subunit